MIGYEVRLSNNHTCNGHPFTDICDELAGKYPKWFKFTKWHPQCRCVCLAIFDDDPGAGEVRDVPANFKQWVTDNQPRLDRSIKKGTAPYWVRDNFSKEGKLTGAGRKPSTPRTAGGGSKPPKPPVTTATAPTDPDEDRRRRTLERAKARHEARTPEELKSIQKAWMKRNRKNCLESAKGTLIGTTAHRSELGDVHFTTTGIKEAINQPHRQFYYKNRAVADAKRLIENGEYVGNSIDTKGRNRRYHYIKTDIKGETSYIVIKEEEGRKTFYSIIDKENEP